MASNAGQTKTAAQPQYHAYNFNPRDMNPKEGKVKEYMAEGSLLLTDLPIGNFVKNEKLETPCWEAYQGYYSCLKRQLFNRVICTPKEEELVACEKNSGMYPKNEDVIARLKTGLEKAKERKIRREEKKKNIEII